MIDQDLKRFASIFDAMMDAVYVVDDEFNVQYMNDVMMKDYGEGIGQKCYRVIQKRDGICPHCMASEVFQGESVRWERYVPSQDRTYTLIEFPFRGSDNSISKVSICRDITESRKAEEKVRASEEYYKRLFENIHCSVYMSSKEGKFVDANQALLDMLGYESKEEFLSIDIEKDLYVRSEDRQKFQKLIERDGRVTDYEVEFKRKDGSIVSVLHTSQARYNEQGEVLGYEGLNVDQTKRKQMEKDLQEANDFLNNVIRSSPNAIMGADMKGNIFIWNKSAEEILGYSANEVIGKMNIRKIYPKGMAKEVMKMMRSAEYGGTGKLRAYPMTHMKKDGEVIEGSLSAAIIYDARGREVASVGIFVDLRETLKMERRLRETQEQLLQSEKLAAMGRLISEIAHELNNPLYGIMNTLELLKTEVSPENKRRRVLEMALSETVRLSELLRNMLSFSKAEEEEKQPVDVNTVLDEILVLMAKQLRENSIRTQCMFEDHLGKVFASKNQLRQIFLNMITNAREAMPDGGSLTIKTISKGEMIHIELLDTGLGIREEYLDKVFDAFFTTKDSVKGVGLGLSVCYGFVKDHGGDLKVTSKVGEGTTFTIILPIYKEGPSNGNQP
ncbi:MAG: PAS domain S-box protein [Deltaproteobacteria bacterium]|nr:PAS domain S-box protein [Deltaproteobacteria bacterium]